MAKYPRETTEPNNRAIIITRDLLLTTRATNYRFIGVLAINLSHSEKCIFKVGSRGHVDIFIVDRAVKNT